MSELHTARLVLRPARPDDAPRFALGLGTYDVARWLAPVPWPFTLVMATEWLRTAPETNRPERALFIVDLPGRGLIGCVALNGELGFWIARPHWGKGYATEAAQAVIDWHFRGSNSDALLASAHHANTASLKVKAKLGFSETGRDRRFSQALQSNVEHVLTRLTRQDWVREGERKWA
jgi:RimJ/RimL family protein N-acetyltransferase